MNYSAIRTCDVANGPGVRVSLFVSGCRHRCKGCFNPDTWDFAAGEPWTEAEQEKVLAGQAYEYPVKNSSQVWEIRPVTPGSLQ